MNYNNKKGFTLIELLVVIAIIGILAALVLVALGNARQKANNAAVKSDLGQLRTLAEVYYDENSASYTGFDTCLTTPTAANCADSTSLAGSVESLISDISDKSGGTLVKFAGDQEFCMETTQVGDADSICVDHTGAYVEGTADMCATGSIPCS